MHPANGQTYSNIEVVSWQYAWNEDTPGAEIGGTKGKATPVPAAVQERLIRLWASPQGAPKAAVAGDNRQLLGANPGTLLADGVNKVRETSLVWEGGKPVITFPILGVPGATGTATLDAKYMTEKVVVKQGTTTTEFTYSDYQDWNNPLNKIDVFYAGKMVEKRNGALVRDITTVETETGNVYVVAPVPASVQAALKVRPLPKFVFAKTEPPIDKTIPTPRQGTHPDLSGNWNYSDWIGNYMTGGGRRRAPTQARTQSSGQPDLRLRALLAVAVRQHRTSRLQAQHWDKVIELDMWTDKYDPVMTCQPLGVPRQGPPRRIIQSENDVLFLYAGGDAGGGYGDIA